jgi:transcriptional regulator with XRE-family HTH domain
VTDRHGSTLGVLVRTYRQRRLWSQQQLADRCNLSVRTIRNLERGIGHPRHDSVRLLAAAFELSEAQHAQLSQAAWDAAPATGSAAKQLPPDLPDFIGRAAEVEAVSAQLQDRPGTVPVVVLAGKPGVGKTALALHVAHRVADRFPDGHLYADLRGAGADPLEPATVLHRFLQALGLDASAIPADPEEREAVYRAALADLRVLVVLDDAGRAAQVRPLLPGSPGCGVLVTGRTRLPGLAGAQVVDVDVPEPDEGVELLAGMAGRARVEADPEVARGIIDRCGRLPLAVRVAGARLSGRPNWPLHRLLSLLDDETGRLDQLAAGDLEVRASLALSYRGLAEPARRAFRLIGAADVGDFSPWLLAPLLDVPLAEAERMVDRLVDACLVDPVTRDGADRYRFHELVRVYARECAGDEDPALLRAAFERLTGCWLALAEEADGLLPTTSDIVTVGPAPRWRLAAEETEKILADPVGWFDLERDNLVAAIRAAAATGPAGSAWELTGTLCAWAGLRNDYAAVEGVQASVAAACRLAGDVRGETAMALIRQLTAVDRSDAEAALGATRSARSTFRRLGDEYGEARALLALAVAYTAAATHRASTASACRRCGWLAGSGVAASS